jgi:hypothetical protein
MHEAGRIRIGEQVPTKSGKTRPKKLGTFRFTSGDRSKIEHVAKLFGGKPQPWQNGPLQQWQVTTEADVIDVIVPPTDMAFSQWFELWSGGGCQRRCDGQRETLTDQPCVCDPDPAERECKPTTRLSLMLAQVQGAGLWRIECHGYYAATELAGSVELIMSAAGRGHLLPATLRLDKRTVTRPGQPRRDFAVPVLDVKLPMAAIANVTAAALGHLPPNGHAELGGASVAELEARTTSEPVPFTPVPANAPTHDATSVAEQVTAHAQRAEQGPKRMKRSAAPVPSSGVKPRTVEQARGDARPATKPQRKAVVVACKEAKLDDEGRHDLIFLVTGGRTSSSQADELLMDDVDQVLVACELLNADHVRLDYDTEGELRLLRGDGGAVSFPVDPGKVRAWIKAQTDTSNQAANDAESQDAEGDPEPPAQEQPTLGDDASWIIQ